jgi:transcriptional regulator with XRE-family HTH domain
MTIGAKIKYLREEKRYSQDFLAASLNTSQATVSRIESGIVQPSVKKLSIIAKILNTSIQSFFQE